MPASLEVVAHTFDGLMKLALKPPGRVGQVGVHGLMPLRVLRARVPLHKVVDPLQETADAFDSLILPVEFAVGRGREQCVHAGAVGAISSDHFIR